MPIYRINDILKKGKTGFTILLVLLFWAIDPPKTWAEDENDKKVNDAKATSPQSENAEMSRSFNRFQVELYGGIIFLNPLDLNLYVSHDNRMQEFFYDSYLDYLVATEQIQSWTMNQGEERKEIRRAFPIGGRLKYYLSETIAISLGFKYMSSAQTLDLDYQYFRNELSDERYNESIRYTPYSLSAKARSILPLLTIGDMLLGKQCWSLCRNLAILFAMILYFYWYRQHTEMDFGFRD